MKTDTTNTPADAADEKLFDNWFDPIETELGAKVRGFIEAMIEAELETALSYVRATGAGQGWRGRMTPWRQSPAAGTAGGSAR
ncbi:MAG: hypothetical protein ACREDA_05105 [Methylocella sp.]